MFLWKDTARLHFYLSPAKRGLLKEVSVTLATELNKQSHFSPCRSAFPVLVCTLNSFCLDSFVGYLTLKNCGLFSLPGVLSGLIIVSATNISVMFCL